MLFSADLKLVIALCRFGLKGDRSEIDNKDLRNVFGEDRQNAKHCLKAPLYRTAVIC